MKEKNIFMLLNVLAILFTIVLFGFDKVFAHCDGMNGPVVTAAKKALETGNVNLVRREKVSRNHPVKRRSKLTIYTPRAVK